jgi:2-methylcitrate dehydratase PrpD
MSITHELGAFLADLSYEALPQRVRERVKDITIDAIGNAIAGHVGAETAQVRALAQMLGASTEATVLGDDRLSLAGATMLNAYLITAVTVCDVHRPTLCHVTPEIIPPALAIAEQVDASGRELLVAIAAGLEATTRIGLGWDFPAARQRGWHAPGVIGPFGGATAVGKLRGLDPQRMRRAFGLAGSQAAGTFAAWGTPTVKFHQARGALSGLLAALLAEQGFVATEEFLTHPDGGLLTTYSHGGRPAAIVADLGTAWELENISLRLWPAATGLQQVITALLALIAAHDLRPADIARVRLALPQVVYAMHGTIGWEDPFRALLSPRYVAAVVLHDRQCWLDQFAPARLADPALDAFARERVAVALDASLPETGVAVEITMRDGRTVADRRAVPKGHPDDPLTRDEIDAKFRMATAQRLESAAVERALDLLHDLDRVDHVSEVLALLRTPR